MSKFGDLIELNKPILLDFFTEWSEGSLAMHSVLRDVAAAIGDKGKVIKINVDRNENLANALRVNGVPTLMIYKDGEMVWRKNGQQDANTLITLMGKYL